MTSPWTLGSLALGAFAIGTQGLSTTVLVPLIAVDLGVSLPVAGQLVTVFALVYALGAPALTAALAGAARRNLVLLSMTAIALTDVAAALAPDFGSLLAARVGMALSSGLFIAVALAYAAATAPGGQSGRALSMVGLGVPVSMIVGVPVATRLATDVSWRAALFLVAGIALISLVAMSVTVTNAGRAVTVKLKDRLRVAGKPPILRALTATVLWSAASYCVLPYLAILLAAGAGIGQGALSYVMLASGIAGAFGMWLGGRASDRLGPDRVRTAATAGLALALAALSGAVLMPLEAAMLAAVPVIVLWGCAAWAFQPAQQAKLVVLAPAAAPVALSLNQSALSLGAAFGAALGSAVIAVWSPLVIGWPAAACAALACVVSACGGPAQEVVVDRAARSRA